MTAPHDDKVKTATGLTATRDATRPGTPPGVERSRVIDRLEQIITQDIGGRGLALDPNDNLIVRCQGNLARAARHLAAEGNAIAIVTGFYIDGKAGPTIETDGPCGAIALAWMLAKLGYAVTLVTDPLGARVIEAGARIAGLDVSIEIFPFEDEPPESSGRRSNFLRDSRRSEAFTESFFRSGPGGRITHLIAVERAGPSHLEPSHVGAEYDALEIAMQDGRHENQVHNFRGQIITEFTAKTHLLFDFIRQNDLPIRTVGIGDGGNEIGMGSIPRSVLHANIPGDLGATIACRVATDWTIACGVSNWGAYALGTAVAWLRGRPELLDEWTDEREHAVLAALVEHGAVDGVTRRRELSVDGLPLAQHLEIWRQIREAVRAEFPAA